MRERWQLGKQAFSLVTLHPCSCYDEDSVHANNEGLEAANGPSHPPNLWTQGIFCRLLLVMSFQCFLFYFISLKQEPTWKYLVKSSTDNLLSSDYGTLFLRRCGWRPSRLSSVGNWKHIFLVSLWGELGGNWGEGGSFKMGHRFQIMF